MLYLGWSSDWRVKHKELHGVRDDPPARPVSALQEGVTWPPKDGAIGNYWYFAPRYLEARYQAVPWYLAAPYAARYLAAPGLVTWQE